MKTLIAFSSKHGTTRDCANQVLKTLGESTAIIDLDDKNAIDLYMYDFIIIGTPLYMGKIRATVKNFIAQNCSLLEQKKIAFFTCGIGQMNEVNKYFNAEVPETLRNKAAAVAHFGAELRLGKMNFLERFAAKQIMKERKISPSIDMESISKFCREVLT